MTYYISTERACVDGCCVIAFDTELHPTRLWDVRADHPELSPEEAMERRGTVGTARSMFNVYDDRASGETEHFFGHDYDDTAQRLEEQFPNDYPPIYL